MSARSSGRPESPLPVAAASLSRSIVRNTISIFAGRAIYLATWALVAPYLLSQLGGDRFGFWSLLTVVSGLYLTFDLGLSSALTKFVAEFRAADDPVALRSVFTRGVVLYAGISTAIGLMLVALQVPLLDFIRIPQGLREEARLAIVLSGPAYGLMNASMLMASVLSGLQRMGVWNRIAIGMTLLQVIGAFVVVRFGGGLPALVLNNALGFGIGTIAAWVAIRRIEPRVRFDMRAHVDGLWSRLVGYSGALQVINLGILVQFQLEKVAFGHWLPLAVVGQYELGSRIAFAAWSVPSLLLPPLLPAVAHLSAAADQLRIERLYSRAMRYVLAAALPLAAGIMVMAGPLCYAWLGPGNGHAASTACALALLLGINILTGPGSIVARGLGRPSYEAEYHVLAMVVHVAMAWILVPRIGLMGGLTALVTSGTIGTVYFLVRLHRAMQWPLGRFLASTALRPLLAAAVMVVVCWVCLHLGARPPGAESRITALLRVALGLGLGGAASTVTLFATGHVSRVEVQELAGLLRERQPRELSDAS